MALSVAEVLIRWRQEGNKEVEASNKRLGASITAVGETAKKAGAVLTAGLTAPLVLIGKQAVDAASDLNEATSAVQTVFGRTADEMVRFSQTAATNLGQSQQAALSAAGALGALFQGVGLNNDQMTEFSQNILKASADLGSFYNVDPGQALQNLRSGLVGEAEPLRRFGILLNEAAVEAKAVELGMIAVGDEMTEAQKVQARYAVIMDQLGAAQGDFARTSDGLANSQRILAAQLQDVRAEIGVYLLPYALRLGQIAADLLQRFRDLDEGTRRMAVGIGAAAAAAGPLLLIGGQLLSTVGKLAPLFGALTGPLGLAALAVAGLGLAFKENWFGIRDVTRTVIDGVLQTLGRMVEFFRHAKDRGLDPFRLAFRTLIVTLGERLGRSHPIVDFLQEVLRLSERLAGSFQNQDWGAFVGELDRADERLREWLSEQYARVETFGAELLQNMVGSFAGLNWDALSNELRAGLGTAAARSNLFEEPNWRQMWDELWANTEKEFEALRNIDQWTHQNIVGGNMNVSGADMAARGQALARNLWENTHDELAQIAEIGNWVAVRFGESDWGEATRLFIEAGSNLIGQLLQGMGDKMLDVQKWIGGGDGQLGLGDRFANSIAGSLVGAKDRLVQAGRDIVSNIANGFWEAWDAFVADVTTIELPTPGGDPAGESRRNVGPGSDPNKPAGTRAMGGPLGRGWTLVGEAGPELISPQGMVIPHGASMARLRGWLPGLAMGGWAEWVAGLSRDSRRLLREARGQGLSAEERQGLMSGRLTIAEDGSIVSSGYYGGSGRTRRDRPTPEERRLARRSGMSRPGFILADDGTWVPDDYYDEPRRDRASRATDRAARQAREAADRADRASRDRVRTGGRTAAPVDTTTRDRTARAVDSVSTFGGSRREERLSNLMSFEDFRKYRRTAAREDREAEIAPVNIYGNVNVYPADGDVHAAIAMQLASRSR